MKVFDLMFTGTNKESLILTNFLLCSGTAYPQYIQLQALKSALDYCHPDCALPYPRENLSIIKLRMFTYFRLSTRVTTILYCSIAGVNSLTPASESHDPFQMSVYRGVTTKCCFLGSVILVSCSIRFGAVLVVVMTMLDVTVLAQRLSDTRLGPVRLARIARYTYR